MNRERWMRAKELADQGCTVTQAARILGIHHTTAIHIAKKMGFQWAGSMKGKYPRHPVETVGRVERMMRLAAK